MDDELKSRLIGYMDAIESKAGAAGEFMVEQAPLVAQEYLAWTFWQNTVFGLLMACGVYFCFCCICELGRQDKSKLKQSERDKQSAVGNVFILIGLLCAFACLCCAHEAAKVAIAPRVVLLEKVAELRK